MECGEKKQFFRHFFWAKFTAGHRVSALRPGFQAIYRIFLKLIKYFYTKHENDSAKQNHYDEHSSTLGD